MLLNHNVSISLSLTVVIVLYLCIYRGSFVGSPNSSAPPLVSICCACLFFVFIVELKSAAERSLANAKADLRNPNRTPHAVSEDTEKEYGFFWADFSCSVDKKPPKIRMKGCKSHAASLRFSMRYPYSLTVRLFLQWVAPLNPLHFLHAPSHSSFHVRNLSVCLCLSCALHT